MSKLHVLLREVKECSQSRCQTPVKECKKPAWRSLITWSTSKPRDQYKAYILARTNESSFNAFVGGVCHSGPLPPSMWTGHSIHTMVRQGECQAKGRIKEDHVALSRRLREPCPDPRS